MPKSEDELKEREEEEEEEEEEEDDAEEGTEPKQHAVRQIE